MGFFGLPNMCNVEVNKKESITFGKNLKTQDVGILKRGNKMTLGIKYLKFCKYVSTSNSNLSKYKERHML